MRVPCFSPSASTTFVVGFASDIGVTVAGTEFIEIVLNLDESRNAEILWIGGITTSTPNVPEFLLSETLYTGTGVSAAAQTLFDLTWTFNSSKNWTLAGSITSDGIALWDSSVTATAFESILEGSSSSFIIGAIDGEVTDIQSGSFGAVPEPSTAAALGLGAVLLSIRRRLRVG